MGGGVFTKRSRAGCVACGELVEAGVGAIGSGSGGNGSLAGI